ncbi:MAG: transporter substrate-binding domain-containing protein [bacterium]|nr:transporter substrate-binding domain-containing protein [bacterium]
MALALLAAAGCSSAGNTDDDENTASPGVCDDVQRVLSVGFYPFFAPVSFAASDDPESEEFHQHLGYEADLLNALEEIEDVGLSFTRRAIPIWEGIWLESAGPDYDLVGGGITILDSRTLDSAGNPAIRFTNGHITFRQSLLVRTEDAELLAGYDQLTSNVRVGVLPGTTGEARLLELTGLVGTNGALAAGTEVVTPQGTVEADGSLDYFITAAGASEDLRSRYRIIPATETMPQVVYLGEQAGEVDLLDALADRSIDAVARGEIGNLNATHASGGAFTVSALDDQVEYGGFTVDLADEELASCLNEAIDFLTDGQGIGYSEWLDNPSVFMERALSRNSLGPR